MTKKQGVYAAVVSLGIITAAFASCARGPSRTPPIPYTPPPPAEKSAISVGDYRGKDDGAPLPSWLSSYLAEGNAALSALAAESPYEGMRLFVGEETASTKEQCEASLSHFDAALDSSSIVFLSLYHTISDGLSTDPFDVYGTYYETLLKTLADAVWEGAEKKDATWVYDTTTQMYYLFTLIGIPRDAYYENLRAVLDSVPSGGKKERVDAQALSRLRNTLLEGS